MTRLTANGLTSWTSITLTFWNLLVSASWDNKLNWQDAPKTEAELGWRFVLTTDDGSIFSFTRVPFFGWWVKAEMEGYSSDRSMYFDLMVNPKALMRTFYATAIDALLDS